MAEVKDVSPGLLKEIQEDFDARYKNNSTIDSLYKKVRDGTATYLEANQFALEVGGILADVFQSHLSSEALPDGKMYYNIAKAVVEPMLVNNYSLVTSITQQVQTRINKDVDVGIKAVVPPVNQDRIDGIVNRVSSEDDFNKVKWILAEPVINYSQSIVAESIEANAEFQYSAGLSAVIVRKSTGKCCEWCQKIVGVYDYPPPNDIWRRHDYCRCTVDYVINKEHRENVHNNNTGKRRYVSDGYGGYTLSKDARIARAKEMAETESARKKIARQKRIATWERKRAEQA